MEKAVLFSREHAKKGCQVSHEAWVEAGKPPSFRFNHATNQGEIVKDSEKALRYRKIKKLRKEVAAQKRLSVHV